MKEAARKPAPTARLRVAVYAMDLLRRTALSQVVAEAGHIVVGAEDTADVVLADGDCAPGETRPVVTLGGTGDDRPGMLSRDAGADQIDAAIRAVAAGLIVRLPEATNAGFGAMRETDGHALLTPRELEVLATLARRHDQQGNRAPIEHLAAHREIPCRIAVPKIGGAHKDRSGSESLRTPAP